jgi:hypothetical protein
LSFVTLGHGARAAFQLQQFRQDAAVQSFLLEFAAEEFAANPLAIAGRPS